MNDQLVEALEQYIQLLEAELNDVVPMAFAHGWRSHRFEDGEAIRARIMLLKAAAKADATPENEVAR